MNITLEWLLDESNPSVRYRTLVELLNRDPLDTECQAAKKEISLWQPVKDIFDKMHPDGYWSANGKYQEYGMGLDYKGYSTTPHILHHLAELGLDRNHPLTNFSAQRYLKILDKSHGFKTAQSCIDGYTVRALIMLGFRSHPTVQKLIALLLDSIRWDNGCFCGQQNRKKNMKSCMRGSWQVIMAFSELPEIANSEACRRLTDYFLSRNLLFRKNEKNELLRPETAMTIFPFVHGRAGLLEILYSISKLGYGNHSASQTAWNLLEEKQKDGRYILDWSPNTYFPTGKRGQTDKWVTLYALLAKKYRDENIINISEK
jgi:hypothetical protein